MKMNIFKIILLLLPLFGIRQKSIYFNRELPNGCYKGAGSFVVLYVKINNDTSIVDIINWDKFPRNLFVDTLLYNYSNKRWEAKVCYLYAERNNCYINSFEASAQKSLSNAIININKVRARSVDCNNKTWSV
jgi:hypothetical protein